MWGCEALEEFPLGVSNLLALEELDFARCRSLEMISECLGNLQKLKILHMWGCEALEEYPFGVTNLLALENINYNRCTSLRGITPPYVL
jgi:hypothetical protein